jgi:hypothetical protein
LTKQDSRQDHSRIIKQLCSNRRNLGEGCPTLERAPEKGKPATKIGGGLVSIVAGSVILLLYYFGNWVTILIHVYGEAAVAYVTGAQLQTGVVNLSVAGHSLPADLLGYLHVSSATFQLIQGSGLLTIIIGISGILTVHAGHKTTTKILGVFTLVLFLVLLYECSILVDAFNAGTIEISGWGRAFDLDVGLGFTRAIGGLGLLASGIMMTRVKDTPRAR